MISARWAFIHTRSRPYRFVMAMSGSLLAVCVWVWMACLPPIRRKDLPSSGTATAGSSHCGVRGRPAFSQASEANWNLPEGVFHFGYEPYLNAFSGKVLTPQARRPSRDRPTVLSCASASSSTVKSKYWPTPHASASSEKIWSTGLVLGCTFSMTWSRMATAGTLPP